MRAERTNEAALRLTAEVRAFDATLLRDSA
jgi:hypothetical protein